METRRREPVRVLGPLGRAWGPLVGKFNYSVRLGPVWGPPAAKFNFSIRFQRVWGYVQLFHTFAEGRFFYFLFDIVI